MEKILLIDDERPILEVLDISLSSEGYEVLTAESGPAGLEIFKREDPRLVITDIKMPGMDGLEVLRRIREFEKEAEVIVITGHGDMDTAISALQYGASDFITKPVKDEALMLAIRRAEEKIAIASQLKEHTKNLEDAVQKCTLELKTAQQELLKKERLATIGETVAGLAHYIKNILNGLRGGMYKMNSAMDREEPRLLQEGWQMAHRNVEKISELVLDLLSYSVERELRCAGCIPNEIVSEVVESLKPLAEENKVQLRCSLDSNIGEIHLDADRIHRAILNLALNAIEACIYDPDRSKSFRVQIKTRLERDGSGSEKMVLEVTDNGCGLSKGVRAKLFSRFFTTKKEKGTGLGLLITQKIIREHGGEIEVESAEGIGSTFRVALATQAPEPHQVTAESLSKNMDD
jgi:signal transduction histidine kinase